MNKNDKDTLLKHFVFSSLVLGGTVYRCDTLDNILGSHGTHM